MKLPRSVSGREVVRALERRGFEVLRQKASHIRLSDGVRVVSVPDHPFVAVGTLRNILRQGGIEPEEFVSLMG